MGQDKLDVLKTVSRTFDKMTAKMAILKEQNKIMRSALEEISQSRDIEVNEEHREWDHGPTQDAKTAKEALEKCRTIKTDKGDE